METSALNILRHAQNVFNANQALIPDILAVAQLENGVFMCRTNEFESCKTRYGIVLA